MKTILEIKEYDIITGNENYKNDTNYKFLDKESFKKLISFIHEFVPANDETDALECLKIGFKRGLGDVVSAQGYVGLIEIKDEVQIQILPKISLSSKHNDSKITKEIFLKMLRSMDDFEGKIFSSANLNVDRMNLYEIFINIYLTNVMALIKKGLKSNYIDQEENLLTVKGKIKIQKHIQLNISHKEKLYCSFDEYDINRPENKLIKAALIKLLNLTERDENKKAIRQLLTYFDDIEPSINHELDASKVSFDRSMNDYKTIIEWSLIFLKNKSFSTFSGSTTSRSLLFSMDKLFESYVAKLIKKYSLDYKYNVSVQDKGHYLFDEPTQQFSLRPDLVVTKQDGTFVILDTKWKKLINNPRKNYGISQSDMYQMYAYAKKYTNQKNIPNVWLLYPINEEMQNQTQINFKSDDGVNVFVYFIDLENAQQSILNLLSLI